ncbi:MAG: hypothetical protein P4L60_05750 [Clostridium sp.]|nr:hypothetical protein [Clostridium sp.]
MLNSVKEISVKTKTGKNIILDFSHYTYQEYTFNGFTISLGSEISDSFNEIYTVIGIMNEIIVIIDSEGTSYGIPKENIIYYKIVSQNLIL